MQPSHPASFYRTGTMVVCLVLLPLVIIFPFVLAGILIPMPGWMLMVVSFAGVILSIFVMLRVLARYIMPPCTVGTDTEGIRIVLDRKAYIYPPAFFIPWSALVNASVNQDANGNRCFIQLKSHARPGNCILTAPAGVTPENWPLWEEINARIGAENQLHPEKPISRKGFYAGTWARILLVFFLLVFVAGIALRIYDPKAVEAWKLLIFGSMGLFFTINVREARRKK